MKSVNVLTATILVAIASVSIAEQRITKSDLPAPHRKPLMHRVPAQPLLVMQRMSKKET